MKFQIIKADITKTLDIYYIAHCVSCDCAMGAGVALAIKNKFPIVKTAIEKFPNIGDVIQTGRIINLFTKQKYFHKPTIQDFIQTIYNFKEFCIKNNIKYLAIPKLGCGLDKLDWKDVEPFLREMFEDIDIEILVCVLD